MKVNNAIKPANTLRGNSPLMQAAQAKTEQSPFAAAVLSATLQNQIMKSVPDERSRARFTSAIIQLVSENYQLQKCTPASVVSAALRGEGQGLILGHGYYVVPYGEKASYITSYRGYISLAMATGLYADLDCLEVREGEFKGRDRRTGKQAVDFSVYETDEERNQHPIVGYYAYFELKDGFFRSEYWDMGKLLDHATRYSQAFNIELFKKSAAGTLTPEEARKVENGSPWYTNTDRMCKKTVLRSLLNSGFAPLSNEVRNFIANDVDERIIPDTPVRANIDPANDPLIIDATATVKAAPAEESAKPSQADDPLNIGNAAQTREKAAQTDFKTKGKEIPTEPPKTAQKRSEQPQSANRASASPTDSQEYAQPSLFDTFK